MKKKIIALGLAVVILVGGIIGGTLAYLADVDSDVNVMVTGNVHIQQLEYERVVENGSWVASNTADKYGYYPDALQEFTQNKPLYPAVFRDGVIKWDDRNGNQNSSGTGSHQQSWAEVGAPGSNQLFDDSVKNAQDKFVFVENTGKSEAYVRTWFAFEQGCLTGDNFNDYIMTNANKNHWEWASVGYDVEIDGSKYYVMTATYKGPASNPTGILAPGATSYASLLQVYMKPEATNEISESFGETYEILVLSQATQVEGFENATMALDSAFGEINVDNVPWNSENGVSINLIDADEAAQLKDATANGENVTLLDDIVTESDVNAPYGNKTALIQNGGTFDGNGNTLSVTTEGDNYVVMTSGGTIKNLTIDDGFRGIMIMNPTEDIIIDNVTISGDVCYTINTGEGSPVTDLIVTNSVIDGWTSIGSAVKSVSFTDCAFGQGQYYTDENGRLIKFYVNGTVTDCSFIEGYYLDLSSLAEGSKVVFEGCTIGDDELTIDKITASHNWRDYSADFAMFAELPSWATSLADCVVFN